MKRFLILTAILAACASALAQQPVEEGNVSWRAASQIAIRGNLIERVGGGVQSIEDDVIAELAKLPADDSGKWQLTVLTMPNCSACEKLKADLSTSREWAGSSLINTQDHTKSWFHYNVYRHDDPTVQDWRRGLNAWLKSHGKERDAMSYPQIVLQPPASGAYGPKTEVVYWQVGYGGKPDKLRGAIVPVMQDFAKVHKTTQLVRSDDGGHGQQIGGGWTPPFSIPPASVPASEGDWSPNVLIPPSQAATAAELQLACPGAPAEFLFGLLARQVTKEEAAAAWSMEKQKSELAKLQQQLTEALEKLKNPSAAAAKAVTTPPATTTPTVVVTQPPATETPLSIALKVVGIFAGGSVTLGTGAVAIGYGIKGLLGFRQKKVDAGQKPVINEQVATVLNRLDDFLIAFGQRGQNQLPPNQRPENTAG